MPACSSVPRWACDACGRDYPQAIPPARCTACGSVVSLMRHRPENYQQRVALAIRQQERRRRPKRGTR